MTPVPHVHTLSCTEPNCRLPVGRIVDNNVVIMAKHHGEKHYAKIPLTDLLKFLGVNLPINSVDKPVTTG